MFTDFPKSWPDLSRGRTGHRFRSRYENRKQSGQDHRWRGGDAESRVVASALHSSERKIRATCIWGKRHWRSLPPAGKAAAGTLLACGAGGSAFVSCKVFIADYVAGSGQAASTRSTSTPHRP